MNVTHALFSFLSYYQYYESNLYPINARVSNDIYRYHVVDTPVTTKHNPVDVYQKALHTKWYCATWSGRESRTGSCSELSSISQILCSHNYYSAHWFYGWKWSKLHFREKTLWPFARGIALTTKKSKEILMHKHLCTRRVINLASVCLLS